MIEPDDYSVRELDGKFDAIQASLVRIEMQTTRTNGRVDGLERWQSFMQGGLAILAILVVPIILYIITGGLK